MRWYFAIDERGALGLTGEDAKTAVLSASQWHDLEPRLLYFGRENEFTGWMTQHGVEVIYCEPEFVETIRRAEAAGVYKSHTIGHWLRVAIPRVETEQEFVLYTDCDVIFLKQPDIDSIRPNAFAAAPEFKIDNWNFFNSGVMVLNVSYLKHTYPAFKDLICQRILDRSREYYTYDDERALNEMYRGWWDKLDPKFNWKPYWGFNPEASILHFHGAKLNAIEHLIADTWPYDGDHHKQIRDMVDGHIDGYMTWFRYLAEIVRPTDPALSMRMIKATTGLIMRKLRLAHRPIDLKFMDFCMF